MKNIFLIILFALLIISCSEDNPTEPKKNYTGITRTSEDSPDPIGEIDSDDWYPDTSGNGLSTYSVLPAYPNPTTRYTKIRICTPEHNSIKIWIDDPMSNKQTIIVDRVLNAGVHEFKVDLYYGDDNYERKIGVVRAFIDFVKIADIPLIHGDIQIIK
jgi:hypothetical protein